MNVCGRLFTALSMAVDIYRRYSVLEARVLSEEIHDIIKMLCLETRELDKHLRCLYRCIDETNARECMERCLEEGG